MLWDHQVQWPMSEENRPEYERTSACQSSNILIRPQIPNIKDLESHAIKEA